MSLEAPVAAPRRGDFAAPGRNPAAWASQFLKVATPKPSGDDNQRSDTTTGPATSALQPVRRGTDGPVGQG